VPLSVVLVFAIVAVLAWSVRNGQFEDIEQEGERILEDDDSPSKRPPP
jgi:cbb3-type cytochrome oxidase maturation protein